MTLSNSVQLQLSFTSTSPSQGEQYIFSVSKNRPTKHQDREESEGHRYVMTSDKMSSPLSIRVHNLTPESTLSFVALKAHSTVEGHTSLVKDIMRGERYFTTPQGSYIHFSNLDRISLTYKRVITSDSDGTLYSEMQLVAAPHFSTPHQPKAPQPPKATLPILVFPEAGQFDMSRVFTLKIYSPSPNEEGEFVSTGHVVNVISPLNKLAQSPISAHLAPDSQIYLFNNVDPLSRASGRFQQRMSVVKMTDVLGRASFSGLKSLQLTVRVTATHSQPQFTMKCAPTFSSK